MDSTMANSMHQLEWIMWCSYNWSNIFLSVFWIELTFESVSLILSVGGLNRTKKVTFLATACFWT